MVKLGSLRCALRLVRGWFIEVRESDRNKNGNKKNPIKQPRSSSMRFLYWREASQTVETTLWFAMQEAWNMCADVHADFMLVRPGAEAYCRVVVREALLHLHRRRERYLYVVSVPNWPGRPLYGPRGWQNMAEAQRDHWFNVEWPHMQRLELLGDGITPQPVVGFCRLYPRESQWLLMQDLSRWHRRAKAARAARHLLALKQIPAVLERAALVLRGRLHQNRDVLDDVLRQAAAAMYAEQGLDPRTRLALAHM